MTSLRFLSIALAAAAAAAIPAVEVSAAQPARAAAPVFSSKRLSVLVKGSGPDVILIPGLASSRDVWSGTVAAVPGYRYHLVQVAGFAGERPGANARGAIVAPVAEEIARYIAVRGLRRPALVGHSMGGTLAMMVAARHPQRVGKVMVVDMLPQPAGLLGSSAPGIRGLADSLRGLTETEEGRELVASVVDMFAPPAKEDERSDRDVVARATHELAVTDLTPELPRIAAPLTVVYASPEPRQTPRLDREYAGAYAPRRGARLVRIDRSGHMIMFDQPARFHAELRAFLKS
jgi:pimeloyl-ACP methyl ester carboxylesterase